MLESVSERVHFRLICYEFSLTANQLYITARLSLFRYRLTRRDKLARIKRETTQPRRRRYDDGIILVPSATMHFS